jgi:hypothetical protein
MTGETPKFAPKKDKYPLTEEQLARIIDIRKLGEPDPVDEFNRDLAEEADGESKETEFH